MLLYFRKNVKKLSRNFEYSKSRKAKKLSVLRPYFLIPPPSFSFLLLRPHFTSNLLLPPSTSSFRERERGGQREGEREGGERARGGEREGERERGRGRGRGRERERERERLCIKTDTSVQSQLIKL